MGNKDLSSIIKQLHNYCVVANKNNELKCKKK